MHRSMIVGSSIVLISIVVSVIFFIVGYGQSLDTAAFLGETEPSSEVFYKILMQLLPLFFAAVGALAIVYLIFGIRRQVTRATKGARKFFAIFFGFLFMLPFAFYSIAIGILFTVQPMLVVKDVSVSNYIVGMSVGLIAIGVGCFLNFLGSFKA